MEESVREYPLFALCGLNCGLCPRYHTQGESKCPGCGGRDFHLKHPTCPVMTCNRKHDRVEYCYQCSAFPCEKYRQPSEADSFISYRNVLNDFARARAEGLEQYKQELQEKIEILECLLGQFNDGRRKNYFCIAVNLLPLNDLREVMAEINRRSDGKEAAQKEKTALAVQLVQEKADKAGIELRLRK